MAPPSSSWRDRTSEFLAMADRLKKSHPLPLHASSSSSSSFATDGIASKRLSDPLPSEFNRKASRIGLSIHQTSQKLSKLAKLAKRTSMFDDPAVEIQELTAVIKQDITALNSAITDLQSLCDSRNASASYSAQSSEHSTTVVDNLKNRLMSTTKEFKEVLTLRTENLKLHESRKQLFSAAGTSKEGINSTARKRTLALNNASSSSAAPVPWANGLTSNPLRTSGHWEVEEASVRNMQQSQQVVAMQDSYMQSRAEALQNVESTIAELSNIFTQLATMVAQQGELAIRIDENIDDTLSNVEGAQGALLKYLNHISSNRWLIIKIFCVLVVFMLIFITFVA